MPLNTERCAELSAILSKRFPMARPHLLARAIVTTMRAAQRIRSTAERVCNYGESEDAYARRAKREAKLAEKLAAELCEACGNVGGIVISFGGDPRGPCAWMRVSATEGTDNGGWMRGDGWDSAAGFPLS